MAPEPFSDVKFEIGHVLFIDIVGYSKLLINEQRDQIQKLKAIVRERSNSASQRRKGNFCACQLATVARWFVPAGSARVVRNGNR